MGSIVSATLRPPYPREREPVLIAQEAGWAPEPVWMGMENLAPTRIQSPDPPAIPTMLSRPKTYTTGMRIADLRFCTPAR